MSGDPYYSDEHVTVHHGDCLDVLAATPADSVDAVITDPPYGLEFMGKEWDGADGFRRSLNPADAGRESVFGRTSAKAPEYRTDSKSAAGMAATGYTDGGKRLARPDYTGGLNPKCLACGKWQRGSNPCGCAAPVWTQERLVRLHTFQEWCEAWAVECLRVLKPGGYMLAFGGSRTWHRLAAAVEDAGFEIRDSIAWLYGSGFPKSLNIGDGRGTALKPAFEPIVVGRKPLVGTVAANVLTHGTGALNIDACRTGVGQDVPGGGGFKGGAESRHEGWARPSHLEGYSIEAHSLGRWPTNVVLDGDTADALDAQAGVVRSSGHYARTDGLTTGGGANYQPRRYADSSTYDDHGGPSRFFPTFRYEAKAPTAERPRADDGTAHPTVKPLDLMRWLVQLATPRGGLVLDPFLGSGTTAEACVLEGYRCVGIERDATYLPLIEQRLRKPVQTGFDFGESA